jgi:hypothetical protein
MGEEGIRPPAWKLQSGEQSDACQLERAIRVHLRSSAAENRILAADEH